MTLDMNEEQLDALVAAAVDGVAFDGLTVTEDEDGFVLVTPRTRRTGLTADDLRAAAETASPFVTNWYFFERALEGSPPGTYPFLRWLERAEEDDVAARYDALRGGIPRGWGQLSITARLGQDGHREYDLCHQDDDGTDPEALDRYADPLDARQLAKFDDRDRYRPLKTAPTLRTGWVFAGLGPRALVRAVDFFYPATVANWALERRGDLDVSHWRETAGRQTGIYDVVDELPPAAVDRAAAACCVDSQCLKRRRWEFDHERSLDVDPGDGEFPCREPCSFLIAAAREWALLEREETRRYEFELTPSERDQMAAIVDAVADGRIDEIREADFEDPANRYRARYLRAKRFETGDSDDDTDSETT